jgi:hypothetical protein
MKARLRIIVAASLCLLAAGTPARAQQAENTTAPPPSEVVGPPQLKDFTLNGTVTRTPESAPPQQPAPQQRQPATTATSQGPARNQALAPSSATSPKPSSTAEARTAPQPADVDILPSAEPDAAGESLLPTEEIPPPLARQSPASEPSGTIAFWPWIAAALALAATLGWFLLWQRPRQRQATAGRTDHYDSLVAAEPAPASEVPPPVPAQPKPAEAQAPPAKPQPPSGVVSTRLRPWLELEVQLGRAIVDDKKAAVEFHLTVFNSGSIAARNVRIEASLFNAGPHQDAQIQGFFDAPLGEGDPIEAITPMQRISIDSAVILPREQVQPIEWEGRLLFVPLIAFNALYAWPGGGPGQTSASYLVGKQTDAEKLAPFRLDLGPRLFRNLAVREHELRLRK